MFKVGDRVQNNCHNSIYFGRRGNVCSVEGVTCLVKWDNINEDYAYQPYELMLVHRKEEPMFKVGDIVRVNRKGLSTHNWTGDVTHVIGAYISVDHLTYERAYHPSELMLVRSAEAGANPATSSTQPYKEDNSMPFVSTNLVGSAPVAPATTKRRRDLVPGDLYRNRDGGKVYMATGVRTAPPSGNGRVAITVDGVQAWTSPTRNLGTTVNGQIIVGFQALVVRGKVSPGEDGAVVTFDGDKDVVYLGRAGINLPSGV